MKYIKYVRERFSRPEVPVFTLNELRLRKGISPGYLKMLVHNLSSRGEIRRVAKGVYTFHDYADVVCFAFSPSYYGLEDALSIMGISDQGTNPTVVTPRNVRRGRRQFMGRNYLVYHLDRRLFFGYGQVKKGEMWLPVSDLEKTVIDMFYFRFPIRDDLWDEILEKIDMKKLRSYLKRYDIWFGKNVIGTIREKGLRPVGKAPYRMENRTGKIR